MISLVTHGQQERARRRHRPVTLSTETPPPRPPPPAPGTTAGRPRPLPWGGCHRRAVPRCKDRCGSRKWTTPHRSAGQAQSGGLIGATQQARRASTRAVGGSSAGTQARTAGAQPANSPPGPCRPPARLATHLGRHPLIRRIGALDVQPRLLGLKLVGLPVEQDEAGAGPGGAQPLEQKVQVGRGVGTMLQVVHPDQQRLRGGSGQRGSVA